MMTLKPGMEVVVHPCSCLLREDAFFTEGEMLAEVTFFEVAEEPLARIIIKCQGREKALEMSTNGHVVLGDPEGKEFGVFFAAWTIRNQDVELVVAGSTRLLGQMIGREVSKFYRLKTDAELIGAVTSYYNGTDDGTEFDALLSRRAEQDEKLKALIEEVERRGYFFQPCWDGEFIVLETYPEGYRFCHKHVLEDAKAYACPRCGSEFHTWELFQAHVQEPHTTELEEPPEDDHMPEGTEPCMGCGKLYGHLEGCTLAKAQEGQQ